LYSASSFFIGEGRRFYFFPSLFLGVSDVIGSIPLEVWCKLSTLGVVEVQSLSYPQLIKAGRTRGIGSPHFYFKNMAQEKFDLWAIVELFGHSKIAGHITEQNIAGTNMLRVDVPETSKNIAFTRFFGSSAIYAINPVDEQTATHFAEQLQVAPIQSWDIKSMIEKNSQLKSLNIGHVDNDVSEERDLFDAIFDDED